MMPKTLRPTLRERNRYLVFEMVTDANVNRKQAVDAIWGSLLRMYGEAGAAKTSMWVMDYEPAKKKGILKVNHMSANMLRACITVVTNISGRKARIDVLKTSGTLRKARENL